MSKKDIKEETSPSGRYKFTLALSKEFDGYWQWSICKIYKSDGEFISVVHRNYTHFPFAWIENHFDGHDYLICGEDYQGQTIIQLDTKLRRDFIPDSAGQGVGFCWIEIEHTRFDNCLSVVGCYWGAPEERVTYDFSNPMNIPYTELERCTLEFDDD